MPVKFATQNSEKVFDEDEEGSEGYEDESEGSQTEGSEPDQDGPDSDSDQSESAGQDADGDHIPSSSDKAKLRSRAKRLSEIKMTRVIGPVEELISIANSHYNKGEYVTALKVYGRAVNLMDRSGRFECHDDYISCILNMGEANLHLNEIATADALIQPVLLKLDTTGGTTVAQQDSALRLLVKDARIWWRSIFPPEMLETQPKKTKKKKPKTKKKKKKPSTSS